MRTILSFGALLLLFALALNLSSGSYDDWVPHEWAEEGGLSSGTSLRIFSCGVGFRPERYDQKAQRHGIYVDGARYGAPTTITGLRAAAVLSTGEVDSRTFELHRYAEESEKLDAFVRSLPVDSILALGVYNTALPAGRDAEARTALLTTTFALLGAKAPPVDARHVSWAFVAVRRPRGWVPIAEKRSDNKGISLVLSLPSRLARYDTHPPHSVRFEDDPEIWLVDWYADALTDELAVLHEPFEIRKVPQRAIQASTPFGPHVKEGEPLASRVSWPLVLLGPGARFSSYLGIRSDRRGRTAGVRFEVWIDGELLASRELAVDPLEEDSWHTWRTELPLDEPRWVSVELRVVPLEDFDWTTRGWSEPAFWGDPWITYPKLVPDDGAVPLGDNKLDVNSDGIVTRGEVGWVAARFDRNKDGIIETGEAPARAIRSIDANGDGRATRDEITLWIEELWRRTAGREARDDS